MLPGWDGAACRADLPRPEPGPGAPDRRRAAAPVDRMADVLFGDPKAWPLPSSGRADDRRSALSWWG